MIEYKNTSEIPTLSKIYEDALQVASAVNLTGVVLSFANVCEYIRAVINTEGGNAASTQSINTHPVMVLYAAAIADLSGIRYHDDEAVKRARAEVARRLAAENFTPSPC